MFLVVPPFGRNRNEEHLNTAVTSVAAETFVLPPHLDYDGQLKRRTSSRVCLFSGFSFCETMGMLVYASYPASPHYYNPVCSNLSASQRLVCCDFWCWELTLPHIGAQNKYAGHDGHGISCRFKLLLVRGHNKYAVDDVNATYRVLFI